MDAASAAAMSDPDRNPAFRRRWQDAHTRPELPTQRPKSGQDALELTGRELLEQWRRDYPSYNLAKLPFDWSFEFIWPCSTSGHGLIGLFASVGGSWRRR